MSLSQNEIELLKVAVLDCDEGNGGTGLSEIAGRTKVPPEIIDRAIQAWHAYRPVLFDGFNTGNDKVLSVWSPTAEARRLIS